MSAPGPNEGGGPTDAASAAPVAPPSAEELQEAEAYLGRENFIKLHKPQLMSMKMPPALINMLYGKLLAEQFDIVESFQVEYVEDEGFRVVCKKEEGLKAGKEVWLIDHMWTTSPDKAMNELKTIDGLVDRLWALADMDFRMEQEHQERKAAREKARASAGSAGEAAPAPAAAAAESAPVELDEDSVSAIMSQAHVSRERAEEAYRANRGDLIAAITWCAGDSEREAQLKEQMTQMAEQQAAAQGHGAPVDSDDELFESSSLSTEQKADLLWPALFRYSLVGSYFTTLLNGVSSSELTSEQVQTVLYVNDEVGSAFGQTSESNNTNAVMAPLVCVTLGGVAFSLLWLTKDVNEGDEIVIQRRPVIRLPGVPRSCC